jgi:FkbM family methyltransferase
MSRRSLGTFISWRALWHLQFVPRALATFVNPITLLRNYIGFGSGIANYRTRDGQRFLNVVPVETEAIFGVFVKREYGDVPIEGDVIDIGANIGAYSIYAASNPRVGRVFAFEPMRETFKRLESNVSSSASSGRILCINAAVGGRSGFVEMINGANSLLHKSSSVSDHASDSSGVRAISLAAVFDTYDIETCAVLKLDCEGAEYEILENLPTSYFKRIRAIRLEIHKRLDGRTSEDLFEFLTQQGFIVEKPLSYNVVWFKLAHKA